MTELPKEKQALAVSLSVSGKYQDVASELDVNILNSDNGMTDLLSKLDASFEKEATDNLFGTYLEIDRFKRTSGDIQEFIHELERRYIRMKMWKLILPDDILGCKLIECSGLEQREKQMVLSTKKQTKV